MSNVWIMPKWKSHIVTPLNTPLIQVWMYAFEKNVCIMLSLKSVISVRHMSTIKGFNCICVFIHSEKLLFFLFWMFIISHY